MDVWFDSGSMSFAQVHYPFENHDWFEHHFPGDFIVEYIGQTRGWFYTLHILATALFDRPAFSSCVSHGIVLGSDGQKMSKSLRNYPDVSEVFDRDGADAMRWFLMSSPILRGGNLIVTEQGIRDGVRQVIIPLWNAWYVLLVVRQRGSRRGGVRRAVVDGLDRRARPLPPGQARASSSPTMQSQMDAYEIANACDTMRSFLDVLTNWYIRRSRDRFWGGEDESATAAFDTLYTTLETVCRVVAPLLPLTTEEIWRGLTGGRSVHLTDWPSYDDLPEDHAWSPSMDRAREVCSTVSALRKAGQLRARLPLAALTVVTADPAALQRFADVIRDEVNVKEVRLVDLGTADEAGFGLRSGWSSTPARPDRGSGVTSRRSIKASKSGDWRVDDDGAVYAAGTRWSPASSRWSRSTRRRSRTSTRRRCHGGGARRPRHGGDRGAGAGGSRQRPGPRRPAGPPRRRPARERPDLADRDRGRGGVRRDRRPPRPPRPRDTGDPVRLVAEPRRPGGRATARPT